MGAQDLAPAPRASLGGKMAGTPPAFARERDQAGERDERGSVEPRDMDGERDGAAA